MLSTLDLGRLVGATQRGSGAGIMGPWLGASADGAGSVWQGLRSLGEDHCGMFKQERRLPRGWSRGLGCLSAAHTSTLRYGNGDSLLYADLTHTHKCIQCSRTKTFTVSFPALLSYTHKQTPRLQTGKLPVILSFHETNINI